MRAKMNKRLLKGLTVLMMVLGFFAVSQRSADAAVAPEQIQPFDSAKDMQNPGDEADLFLYNVFLTGNHSADSADSEGALAIKGSSFVPQFRESGGSAGFHYGAMFAGGGVGEDLNGRNTIALLIGGQIHSCTEATLEVGYQKGLLVTNENDDSWITNTKMNVAGGARTMVDQVISGTFNTLVAKENSLTKRLNSYTGATVETGSVTTTTSADAHGQSITYTAKPSQIDPHVYVVDVEPDGDSDTVFMPQIDNLKKLVDDDQMKEVIFTSSAKKVVFATPAYYGPNNEQVGLAKNSEAARKVSNRTLFYLPNATQVTNYAVDGQSTAPDIHEGASGKNADVPVGTDGTDLYDKDYFKQYKTYSTAVMGSLFAPNATIVFNSGNINGYVMAKNFHQRNGAEAHNFYNPWLESTDVQFTKNWDDDSNRDGLRPGKLTFTVYDDHDTKITTVTIDADQLKNQQTFSVDNLPKYDTDGRAIKYHVVEEPLDGTEYESTADAAGQAVTNKHTPYTTTFQVSKQWQDHNNYLKQRPTSVQMQLYQQDSTKADAPITKVGAPVTLSDANGWTHKWTDLPKNINGGHLLLYSVKEVTTVAGYTATSTDAADKLSTTVTNSYHPTTFRIRLTKHDANSQATLKGATYRLGTVTKDNKVIKDATAKDVTTDDHGQLNFTAIPWVGDKTYYLQEITPPNGYLLDEKIYPIHVKADAQTNAKYLIEFEGKTLPLELDNGNAQAEPLIDISRTDAPAPVLPHTGGSGQHPWLLVGLTSIVLGGIALYLRKTWGVM